MNLLEFQERFSTEAACVALLIEQRWPNGYHCTRCDSAEYGYHPARRIFQCKVCKFQQSVTAGTMFHRSQTPLREWFWAIFLMTTSKKGISALELQRLLGAPYYQRVHHMKQRIQEAMEARESLYQLNTFVEVDEAFFGGSRTGVKGGRGSNHLTTVQVSVAVGENDRPTYAKMKVIPDTTATTLTNTVLEHIEPGSIVVTDGWQGYNRLEEYGYTHLPCSTPTPKEAQLYLPWVHILISNAKRFILGTHHAVQPQNLQRYLNEFCYRFNRRFFNNNLFQRALYAATLFKPDYLTEPII